MPQLEDPSALARRLRDAELLSTQAPTAPQPQLSVVMPTHDVGPWIRETLESLQAQTFTDFELIVVDDHSQDETSEILSELARGDSRIRVVRPDGHGGAHARNVGVSLARGRYLVFCDGDDIVPEGAYAALMQRTVHGTPDIVFGDFVKFSPRRTSRPSQNWRVFDTVRDGLTLADEPALLRHRACWNKAFRSDFWREHDIVFPEVPRSNDIVPMTQAYAAARDITIVPDIVYIYRARPGATSMSSKASGTRSLISYIQQELVCREILLADGTPDALRRHGLMLANADGWVHLKRYLESVDPASHDPLVPEAAELAALLPLLTAMIGDGEIPRPNEVHRRLVLALCEVGDVATAALATRLVQQTPLDQGTVWFTDWARVLRAIPAGSRFTSPEEVAGRWILRRVREAVETSEIELPVAELAALLDVLPPDAVSTNGPLSMQDLRLNRSLTALRERGEQAFAQRLASIRYVRAQITGVHGSRHGVEISGTFETREPITLTALAVLGRHHEPQEIGVAQSSASGDPTWAALIQVDRLSPDHQRSLVLLARDADGEDVLIVPAATPGLTASSPVTAGGVRLVAGAGTSAAVKIQAAPDTSTSSPWWRALGRRLPTRHR